jgi:hypothetical protein
MVRFVRKGAGVPKDVPDILMPVLEQYVLSVRWEPIPILEFVAHIVDLMTVPGAKVKKIKWNQIWSRHLAE